MTKIVKPLRGGQITIPAEFRQKLSIDEDTLLQVTLVDGELRIRPVKIAQAQAGSAWAKELYDLFASVRESASPYDEQDINAAIDDAVGAVRGRKNAKNRH